jgi:hypothetical protein
MKLKSFELFKKFECFEIIIINKNGKQKNNRRIKKSKYRSIITRNNKKIRVKWALLFNNSIIVK